uniref:Uncharacterized protein n=1 Tax=Panagrolaimus sp. PS1159 TaxID=55785 RepID=A0AC35FL57_9BILA
MQSYVIWLDSMNKNDAITVCSDDADLEFFVSNSAFYTMSNYALYDAEDLYSNIGTLDSKSITSSSTKIPRNLKSFSGCFTIYKASESSLETEATVLFQKNSNNCNEKDTIFQPSIYGDNFELSSTSSGSCEMIFLIGSQNLPGIWLIINETTPNTKYTFTNLETNKKLFDLDSSEVWQNLGVYTTALSITIPPSSKLSLLVSSSYTRSIYFQNNQQKGIMTSPCYSHSSISNTLLYSLKQYSSNNFTANFFVKELYGSPTIELKVDFSPKQTYAILVKIMLKYITIII